MTEIILITALSTIVGGLVSLGIQLLKLRHQIIAIKLEHKTDFMAESVLIKLLSHKSYTDRSFTTLKKHLGGFEDDELRRILIRAGAIRVYRNGDTNNEWWRLLNREEEYIKKKKQK